MTRTLTPWTRFPRSFSDFEMNFPKMLSRVFDPDEGILAGDFNFIPEANIAETDKAVEVAMDLPGLKPEEVKVEVHEGQLWITGEKKEEKEEKGKTWHRVERRSGEFRRVLSLPTHVDAEKVDAQLSDGVLKVTLPKAAGAARRAIPVK